VAADKPSAETDSDAPADEAKGGRLSRLRAWTATSRLRGALVGGGLVLLVVATVGTWLYLASLTVAEPPPTLEQALELYDEGDLEEARMLVIRMTEGATTLEHSLAGPLFVLGAIKATEAQSQWSAALRQSTYQIAAKYLQEAKAFGFPPGREEEGGYLLGLSMIESGDNAGGLDVLEEVALEYPDASENVHLTLATAYMQADPPQNKAALNHVNLVLDGEGTSDEGRRRSLINRVLLLAKLGEFEQARDALRKVPASEADQSKISLAAGYLNTAQFRDQLVRSVSRKDIPSDLIEAVNISIQQLRDFPAANDLAPEAMLLIGEAQALLGNTDAAIDELERIRKLYSSAPAGIAASIAEGDLYRKQKGDFAQALTSYRRGLSALESTGAYRSQVLPLSELKQRLLQAHADFIASEQHQAAATLVEQLGDLLGRTKQLELRASTYTNWGQYLLAEARLPNGLPGINFPAMNREGRMHFREAGVDYEELAKRQFATEAYPNHIWQSAESYLQGQSYSSAIRMLNEFLRNEPVLRNAQALLRLGQANLASGNLAEGILALEECIELHPQDAAVFRARLDCAVAFLDQNRTHEAEELFLANLNGSGLLPESPEWRDSLFGLGHLLYDAGRYEEAIDRLDESVNRHLNDDTRTRAQRAEQARLAMYLIAESHRHAAEAPMADLEQAKTLNDREASTRAVQDHLNEALLFYEKVRVDITASENATDLDRAMLRNCYMFKGSSMFDLGIIEKSPQRFKDAIDEYSNVSTLYQNEPFVLETFVQIANCQRRLQQPEKAQLNIDQALQLLAQLPEDADFLAATNFNRSEWKLMLTEMLEW